MIYIAGPMTGYSEFNQEAFQQAEDRLKNLGLEVFNPAKKQGENLDGLTGNEKIPAGRLQEIISQDLEALQTCTAIYMLHGWERSTGARAEHAVATWLGLDIWYDS